MNLPDGKRISVVVIAGLLAVSACGTRTRAPAGPGPAERCLVTGSGAGFGRELTIAVSHPVAPERAPVASNPAESLVFPLLYETLVHVDCQGEARPGLAEGWRSEEDGRVWTFRLDPKARFWDGAPVTAADVALGLLAAGDPPPGITHVGVRDERTLSLRFERTYREVPAWLGDPALSVTGPRRYGDWPLGSDAYRPAATSDSPGADDLRDEIVALPREGSSRPMLRFAVRPGIDGRDLLDEGADLLVTRDADVIEYVGLRPELEISPLAWDRTYVLLSPTRARALARGEEVAEGLPATLLGRLARDAVKGGVRPHGSGGWWKALDACRVSRARLAELPSRPPPAAYHTGRHPRRLAYREGDEAARQLAGRLVALVAGPDGEVVGDLAAAIPGLREAVGALGAVALPDSAFAAALHDGSAFLYVIGIPMMVFDECRGVESLARNAPWLPLGSLDPYRLLVPLIDTRPYLVTRGQMSPIHVGWDGALRFEPPAAEVEER